ncbi:hypothetical protein WICANDRAFT_76661 [Wickerhamomyces anomalus NRRL Y-366-8]|uniref:Mediator of RNA polymerase II transcription subunit 1 n=1 Tax=Wickerhamomyces anomalus (strain ATCC 58044 / CBS 1984 / NCYC 433 / NRRL Y-366-8) TaxID=683960 RepID=A0A1E3PB92_WICAA|nr:uncharacterized protein WICANDRAFT_76661 [Wickerhamomyces anomalus NRRL Y-366-8]ODQ62494.1 hypothetical protein WICANDRAFT_76661 [Wickerhamomyces anomalus NRRL Y-366-8]
MQDTFHQKLSSIVKILKSSPGSVTVQNIQRLSNIHKFETFIETINDKVKRLSIAGKILVMDIDFIELPSKNKDQTRFELNDVRLILANNNNSFKYVNTENGENILKNCLLNYPDLSKFDETLETLSIFDQVSHDDFDLFDYYMKIYDAFHQIPEFDVKMNTNDKFTIIVQDMFEVSLVNDERLNLSRIEYNGEWNDKKQKINDVGLQVKFIGDVSIAITKNILLQNDLIFDDSKKKKLFDSNEVFKSKKNSNLTFQGFQFLESEVLLISEVFSNDLPSLMKVLVELHKFSKLERFIEQLKQNFTLIDKFADLENEDVRLNDFLNGESIDEIEVEHHFITMSLKQQQIELKSDDSEYNFTIDTSIQHKLDEGLEKLKGILEK